MSQIIDDAVEAHRFSNNHKPELMKDKVCGCFYCLSIFSPDEIEEWLVGKNPCDRRGTAICPHCGIDSVIGESSGYPITQKFLAQMHRRWFESGEGFSLNTPFGTVKVFVDGKEVAFDFEAIDPDEILFPDVDATYHITVDVKPNHKAHKIYLKLCDCKVTGDIESGERLEAIFFYTNDGKITLGSHASFGDYVDYGFDYDGSYQSDGIMIETFPKTESNKFSFRVCWLNKCTDENDVQTWFGADPSI